jgi:hypothetical protein
VDLVAAVVTDEQPLEVVQPGAGALDDPADAPQSRAVLGLAASDLRRDATSTQLPWVLVVVVATVGRDAVRPLWWRPTLPRTGGMRSRGGTSCITSLRLPPVTI